MKHHLYSLYTTILFVLVSACTTNNTSPENISVYRSHALDSITSQLGYPLQAKLLLDRLFTSGKTPTHELRFRYLGYVCGYYHLNKGDQDSALLYADSMLLTVSESGNYESKNEALAHISIGDIFLAKKRYNDAYYHYYAAKIAAEKSVDDCAYSEYSYRLGMVLYKNEQYSKAADYFKEAFDKSSSCAVDFTKFARMQEILNNVGLSYAAAGNIDSALHYYAAAAGFIKRYQKQFADKEIFFNNARAVLDGNMALAYTRIDYLKAESLFKKSINVTRQPGNENDFALSMQSCLAQLYFDAGQDSLCFETLHEINHHLDSIPDEAVKIDYNKLVWKLNEKHNNIPQAYKYLVAYNSLKDSLNNDKRILSKANIINQISSQQTAYEMNILKHRQEVNVLYAVIASILFLMAGLFFLLMWNNNRRSKKYIAELKSLNNHVHDQKAGLQVALTKLQQQEAEKERLVQLIVHDLRNPISGISSMIELMVEDHKETENLTDTLRVMKKGCDNALKLINNILTASNKPEDRDFIISGKVNVNQVVNSCIGLLQYKAQEKKITIQLTGEDHEVYVLADASGLTRVINNLLNNAVKFSSAEKIIVVNVQSKNDMVQIEVRDQGIGIPENIQSKIFGRHDEIRRSGTHGEPSFGLGLSICKEIIENYDGKIWFETKQGVGSSFFIQLPQADMV